MTEETKAAQEVSADTEKAQALAVRRVRSTTSKIVVPPSILVHSKITLKGGVRTTHDDVEEHPEGETGTFKKWLGTKVIENVEERKEGENLRKRLVNELKRAAPETAIGFLCPDRAEAITKLDETMKRGQDEATKFNARVLTCQISYVVLQCRLAPGDEAAALQSVADEIASYLTALNQATRELDVDRIKSMLQDGKDFAKLLGDSDNAIFEAAIKEARKIANDTKKEIASKGLALDDLRKVTKFSALDVACSRFLELDQTQVVESAQQDAQALEIGEDTIVETTQESGREIEL